MRWPWTSVARLDDARENARARISAAHAELDWLREQYVLLSDAYTRLQRIQHGVSEVPRGERPQPEPMPQTLKDYIGEFGTEAIRKLMRDGAYRHYREGKKWDVIEAEMRKENG